MRINYWNVKHFSSIFLIHISQYVLFCYWISKLWRKHSRLRGAKHQTCHISEFLTGRTQVLLMFHIYSECVRDYKDIWSIINYYVEPFILDWTAVWKEHFPPSSPCHTCTRPRSVYKRTETRKPCLACVRVVATVTVHFPGLLWRPRCVQVFEAAARRRAPGWWVMVPETPSPCGAVWKKTEATAAVTHPAPSQQPRGTEHRERRCVMTNYLCLPAGFFYPQLTESIHANKTGVLESAGYPRFSPQLRLRVQALWEVFSRRALWLLTQRRLAVGDRFRIDQ